jgi:hypothetical protein
MTVQYQEEDINGQPSPLSLLVTNPGAALTPPAAGLINTSAVFWPTFATDAQIVGNGLSVAGNASLGTIVEFSAPGLFQVTWQFGFSPPPGGLPQNLLLGAVQPIVGPIYPALDFVGGPSPGVIAVSDRALGASPPDSAILSATFRMTDAALVDVGGVVNPLRQLFFSAATLDIPTMSNPITQIHIVRTSR